MPNTYSWGQDPRATLEGSQGCGGRLLPNTSSWGQNPGATLEGSQGRGGHLLPDTSSWGQDPRATPRGPYGAGWGTIRCPTPPPLALKQDVPELRGTVAGWRTADGLVVSDRGTWGPDSTAWTGGGAGWSLRAGPAGPGWGCDFPINPCKRGSRTPSLGHRPDSTHTRRPPGARRAAPPTQLQRTQACSAPAASPPEGLGRCLPSHPRSLPTGLSARGTLLGRPHPAYPQSLRSRTLLGRPRPTSPSFRAPGPV